MALNLPGLPGSQGEDIASVEEQQKQIQEEFEKKIRSEKRSGFFARNRVLIIIGVIALVGLLVGGGIWLYISTRPEPPAPIVVDAPPADFAIRVVSLDLIRNTPVSSIGATGTSVVESYDVLARVSNADPNWGASEMEYSITLLDAAGEIVGTRRGSTFMPPQTERGIVEFQIDSSATAAQASIDITPVSVERMDTEIDIRTQTTDVLHLPELDGSGGQRSTVVGTFLNASPFSLSRVDLIVSVLNAQGKLVGLNAATLDQLASGEDREFKVRWREELVGVSRVEIEVVIDPFVESNFLGAF